MHILFTFLVVSIMNFCISYCIYGSFCVKHFSIGMLHFSVAKQLQVQVQVAVISISLVAISLVKYFIILISL